jgi:hypothetical protein
MKGEVGLKLRARDGADLAIIAACLQDALVRPRDMTYLAAEKRFAFVANRFRWEAAAKGTGDSPSGMAAGRSQASQEADAEFADGETQGPLFQRVHCGVCFDRVRGVKMRGFSPAKGPEFLELLTVQAQGDEILLMFAGNAAVRLEVEAVRCHFEDLGEAWPTAWRPEHLDGDGEDSKRKSPA